VPVASGFVVWLLALVGSRLIWQRARALARQQHRIWAALCGVVAVGAMSWAVSYWPIGRAQAEPPPHGPLGQAQGIHPGRVVWVHAPDATDWEGYDSPTPWWLPEHTDLSVAEDMTREAICSLAGEDDDLTAWEAIFRHFNEKRGKGTVAYQPGEKIAIKINLTACNARGNMTDSEYNKKTSSDGGRWQNTIDNSPQMIVALLRQLVYVAGVAPGDISLGDPTGLFANHIYEPIHAEFPEVICFDNHGKAGLGRLRTESSSTPFHWSTDGAEGKLPDTIPVPFAEAEYIINYAILKWHSAGVTLCAKNHYGSLLRCPDGYLRDEGNLDYFNIHDDLAGGRRGGGMGRYRPLVDLMGHEELGGKTLLYLVDGLFSGFYWQGEPRKWSIEPFKEGRLPDWPNSLFASQDPVAIDSVCYDFLLAEWPDAVRDPDEGTGTTGSAEDYLHEAALGDDPPSGVFYDPENDGVRLSSLGVHEHWNNSIDKQYSRNLGSDQGIELMARRVNRPDPRVRLTVQGGIARISWRASLGCQLELADTLGDANEWRLAEQTPGYEAGYEVITHTASEAQVFYRIVQKP
jgi:hypothetical protein